MDSVVVKIEDLQQQQQDRNLLQKNDNLLLNQVKNEIADQVTSFPVANKVASQTTELVVVEKTFKCESNTDICNDLSPNNDEFRHEKDRRSGPEIADRTGRTGRFGPPRTFVKFAGPFTGPKIE